jgi:hypothetical protein
MGRVLLPAAPVPSYVPTSTEQKLQFLSLFLKAFKYNILDTVRNL